MPNGVTEDALKEAREKRISERMEKRRRVLEYRARNPDESRGQVAKRFGIRIELLNKWIAGGL